MPFIWNRDWCLHKITRVIGLVTLSHCPGKIMNCMFITSSIPEVELHFNEHVAWNEFQLKLKKAAHWDWNGKENSSQTLNYPNWSLTKILLFLWCVSWDSSWSKAAATLTWIWSFLFYTQCPPGARRVQQLCSSSKQMVLSSEAPQVASEL